MKFEGSEGTHYFDGSSGSGRGHKRNVSSGSRSAHKRNVSSGIAKEAPARQVTSIALLSMAAKFAMENVELCEGG